MSTTRMLIGVLVFSASFELWPYVAVAGKPKDVSPDIVSQEVFRIVDATPKGTNRKYDDLIAKVVIESGGIKGIQVVGDNGGKIYFDVDIPKKKISPDGTCSVGVIHLEKFFMRMCNQGVFSVIKGGPLSLTLGYIDNATGEKKQSRVDFMLQKEKDGTFAAYRILPNGSIGDKFTKIIGKSTRLGESAWLPAFLEDLPTGFEVTDIAILQKIIVENKDIIMTTSPLDLSAMSYVSNNPKKDLGLLQYSSNKETPVGGAGAAK
ncbi:MAG: hypothetical protein AABZ06_13380 [Bdellovibrionota bacterium]